MLYVTHKLWPTKVIRWICLWHTNTSTRNLLRSHSTLTTKALTHPIVRFRSCFDVNKMDRLTYEGRRNREISRFYRKFSKDILLFTNNNKLRECHVSFKIRIYSVVRAHTYYNDIGVIVLMYCSSCFLEVLGLGCTYINGFVLKQLVRARSCHICWNRGEQNLFLYIDFLNQCRNFFFVSIA